MVPHALRLAPALALGLGLGLAAAVGCGDSPPAACPPCPAPSVCRAETGVCVGFRNPLYDGAGPDAADAGADAEE